LFKKIRGELTVFYALVMTLFLAILVFGMYSSMQWSITSEQQREVLLYAEEEAHEHAFLMQHQSAFEAEKSAYQEGSGRMYLYAFDQEGNLFNASRPPATIEPLVLDKILHWDAPENEVILVTSTKNFHTDYKLMLTAKPILLNNEQIGTVYVGRDVTAVYHGLNKATLSFALVALAALFAAIFAGYVMAGKAIVPLKQAYNRQKQFTADASHELRTPLSIVLSAIEILEDEPESKTPFIREILSDVKDEVLKMTSLVAGLLLLVRSEQPGQGLDRKPFDLNQLIKQTVRKMQPLAKAKSLALISTAGANIDFAGEREKIQQLLVILLDNAIKYTPAGGSITVSLEDRPEQKQLRLKVEDTGIGIAAADCPRIFERFYRTDKARPRQSGGSGLGLAIAQEIVHLHKGTIQVISKIHEGSIFIIDLPQK